MAMFSKNVRTVLTYLAILIILYGAYKAIVGVHEGAKGNKVKRGLDKIKSSSKSAKKYCRKWTKNIKKRRRKKNSAKQAKKIQGVADKMCYVGCKQVGRLGLSCGAGPGGAGPGGAGPSGAGPSGAGPGGCGSNYSSAAEWDTLVEMLRQRRPEDNYSELLSIVYTNNIIDGCLPTRLITAVKDLSVCQNEESCSDSPLVLYFYSLANNELIDYDTIIYDDENNSMSARFWWMLRLVGIKNCSVLDGGFKAWKSLNLPVSRSVPSLGLKEKKRYSYNDKIIVATKNIMQLINNQDYLLIDAREYIRFIGKKEPIDKKAGHVPGAINMPFKENLEKDGKFKEKLDLIKLFENIDKDKSRDIINMCGSGVTACHNFLAMEYCGLRRSRIYVGSWSAWSSYNDNDNDIEKEQE